MIGLLLCFAVGVAMGQTADANKKKKEDINKIKKSSSYLYGEATLIDADEAAKLAEELLYNEIHKWIASKKELKEAKNVIVKNVSSSIGEITLPRGNMFRAFLYVKKQDILPSENVNVIEQPTVDSAVVSKQRNEENVDEDAFELEGFEDNKDDAKPELPDFLKKVVALKRFQDVQPCLVQLKKEGKISTYGKYANLLKKEEYYLIIYTKEGKVAAVLSKGKERENLATRKPDSTDNYKGCGAIGFK